MPPPDQLHHAWARLDLEFLELCPHLSRTCRRAARHWPLLSDLQSFYRIFEACAAHACYTPITRPMSSRSRQQLRALPSQICTLGTDLDLHSRNSWHELQHVLIQDKSGVKTRTKFCKGAKMLKGHRNSRQNWRQLSKFSTEGSSMI